MQKVVKEYNQHSDAGEKLGWTVWSHTIVLQRRRGAEVGAQLVHCICRHAVLMLDWRCWMTSPFPHVVSSRCMHTRNTHICTGVHLLYLLAYLLCQEGDFTFSSSRLTSFCVSLYLPYFAPRLIFSPVFFHKMCLFVNKENNKNTHTVIMFEFKLNPGYHLSGWPSSPSHQTG